MDEIWLPMHQLWMSRCTNKPWMTDVYFTLSSELIAQFQVQINMTQQYDHHGGNKLI